MEFLRNEYWKRVIDWEEHFKKHESIPGLLIGVKIKERASWAVIAAHENVSCMNVPQLLRNIAEQVEDEVAITNWR